MTFTHVQPIARPADWRHARKLQQSRLASRGDRARGDHAPAVRPGVAQDASPATVTVCPRTTEAGHG